jgi:DNA primase
LFEAREAIRHAGYALVTEGYMDVVALAQLGFAQAVATLGTACTTDHVHKLFRFTDAVVFSFDGDKAGRRAARKALDGALPYATDTRSIKFLFLPQEHDPDSFIRENGSDAFALAVTQAVPLSRFLIDVAREGCDLDTAEGRALLANHAKPLWQALPDGALKRQLLNELAQLIELDVRELSDLWAHPAQTYASASNPSPVARAQGVRMRPVPQTSHTRQPRGRQALLTRADHAARILLTHPDLWHQLSDEDHHVLCTQVSPWAELFIWLEAHIHEHGAQPWAALREALREQSHEELALKLMNAPDAGSLESADSLQELRSILSRMLLEQIDAGLSALSAQMELPGNREKYQYLYKRRQALLQTGLV